MLPYVHASCDGNSRIFWGDGHLKFVLFTRLLSGCVPEGNDRFSSLFSWFFFNLRPVVFVLYSLLLSTSQLQLNDSHVRLCVCVCGIGDQMEEIR